MHVELDCKETCSARAAAAVAAHLGTGAIVITFCTHGQVSTATLTVMNSLTLIFKKPAQDVSSTLPEATAQGNLVDCLVSLKMTGEAAKLHEED